MRHIRPVIASAAALLSLTACSPAAAPGTPAPSLKKMATLSLPLEVSGYHAVSVPFASPATARPTADSDGVTQATYREPKTGHLYMVRSMRLSGNITFQGVTSALTKPKKYAGDTIVCGIVVDDLTGCYAALDGGYLTVDGPIGATLDEQGAFVTALLADSTD